ncbi:MAG: HAD-IIIC family phosphatase, partial [Pirellula sp.]
MKITQEQVLEFARWTGDCNPIHVDPVAAKESSFGGTICHGMLVLIESLAHWDVDRKPNSKAIGKLDVQFRGEVRPDKSYIYQYTPTDDGVRASVLLDRSLQMDLTASWASGSQAKDFGWMKSAKLSAKRTGANEKPEFWSPDEFQRGKVLYGLHRFEEYQQSPKSKLSKQQEQVLGLCSFIVGMKIPGLASLFTKLSVDFLGESTLTQELLYRLTLSSFDDNFRILEMQLDIATADLQPVATCQIECYVRFASQLTSISSFQELLGKSTAGYSPPRLAVICGASRGLGAEAALGLAAARCHVVLVSRGRSSVTETICEQIASVGGTADVGLGDIGDPGFCQSLASSIQEKGHSIDLLVLNACEPPIHGAVGASDIDQSLGYVARNIRLFLSPLQKLLPLVSSTKGCVVGISSSFVEEMPSGYSDYISVKNALETSLRVASKEHRMTRFIVARPPKLQTTWNDTPTAALGALPVRDAAFSIVQNALIKLSEDGKAVASNFSLLSEFPRHKWPKSPRSKIELQIALVSNFTLDPIQAAFASWSDVLEQRIDVQIAPYNQILQELLNPTSEVSRAGHGSAVLIRFGDWIKETSDSLRCDPNQADAFLLEAATEFVSALRKHRATSKGSTLVLVCPNEDHEFPGQVNERSLCQLLASELAGVPGLTLWIARDFHPKYQVPESVYFDSLRNKIGHIPYTDEYYAFLSTLVVRFFSRRINLPKKVIVLDCDNTLWGGVVGEVGAQGLVITSAHRKLIGKLKELSEGGVLLCLASKNEPEDVWQVFDDRDDFPLRREEVVASKINWMPKSQNIQELAKELNLGLDSFVFLDDNPVECAEVRAGCPSVLTVQWPHNESDAEALVDHLWELDLVTVTKEDRERTRMYKEEFERQQVQKSSSNFQDFIDSLQLVVEFKNVQAEDVPRASQLTLRTNQFNLTTVRRNESEIQAMAESADCDVCTLTVRDRFGDYGVVGLFIGKLDTGTAVYEVDTFLLSCRVLGRGVEHKIVAEIARRALDRGCKNVRWRYRPTEKNRPAKLFLEKTLDLDVGSSPSFEALTPAVDLVKLEFRVSDSDPEESLDGSLAQADTQVVSSSGDLIRRREMQIEQTVRRYSRYRGLSTLINSETQLEQDSGVADHAEFAPADNQDQIEDTVLRVFGDVLKRPAEGILQVDRLDSLGCDSLQIVGITVALSKAIPNLPPTLLFEHRSVSEIIKQIRSIGTSKSASQVTQSKSVVEKDGSKRVSQDHDIAIVGISANTAVGADSDALWATLLAGQSKVLQVPRERDDFIGVLESSTPYFAALLPSLSGFDPEFFATSPREAEYMDPQLRLLLQASWHAIEDAGGFRPDADKSMGVFVGYMYQCYGRFANVVAVKHASVYRCWEGFSFANRISQFLGTAGPSLAIDTACSSSATALHFACESLRRGDCSSAIVAGVNALVDPSRLVQLGNLGILTPTGKCVPFGDGADGTVIGEGAVCVYLKPLSSATRDGDRIYAVIRGTGVSVGAGSVGFTAPNPVAQSLAIRAALDDARVDPRTIGYVETHGTGTQLGDPIEVRGLEMAYCDPSRWDDDLECQARTGIGSIKPNIGHLEAGAGLVGVVKAALQLHYKTLLPSITSEEPNPQIPFDKLPFKVQRNAADWAPMEVFRKSSQATEILPRRAAVNSFGVGGSNAHIILEEAPQSQTQAAGIERSSHLLILQAPDTDSLQLQAAKWSNFLRNQAEQSIGDAVYSNVDGHRDFKCRAAVVIDDLRSASSQLERWSSAEIDFSESWPTNDGLLWGDSLWKKANRIAYLFTGQGAQYPGMLEQFYLENPVFKQAVDECSKNIDSFLQNPIRRILFDQNPDATLIHQTRFTQPSMFVIQYGLFKLWESYGVKPDALLGHSIGEIAAYCVSGGCSLADALRLVSTRGELMQRLDAGGGMTSIAACAQTVESLIAELGGDLSIAAYNGPNQTVVSGSLEHLSMFADRATSAGIKTQSLKVSHAFHSKLMEPMLDEFRSVVSKLALGVPSTELISTVTGERAKNELASPEYWVDQVRQPVRFMQAMETLSSNAISHFIEIGPHPVLLTMARSIGLTNTSDSTRWLPSARRGYKDWSV